MGLNAEILKRWDAEQRAQAPLDLMEPVQVVVALMGTMVLFAMSLPSLMRVLRFCAVSSGVIVTALNAAVGHDAAR